MMASLVLVPRHTPAWCSCQDIRHGPARTPVDTRLGHVLARTLGWPKSWYSHQAGQHVLARTSGWPAAGQHVFARTPGQPACLGTNTRLARTWHGNQAGQHVLARKPGWPCLMVLTPGCMASMSWHEHQWTPGRAMSWHEHQAGPSLGTDTRLASMSWHEHTRLASMSWHARTPGWPACHQAGQHVLALARTPGWPACLGTNTRLASMAGTPGWPACLGTNARLASMSWHGQQVGQDFLARTPGLPACLGTNTIGINSWLAHVHQAGPYLGTNASARLAHVLARTQTPGWPACLATNTRLASMS